MTPADRAELKHLVDAQALGERVAAVARFHELPQQAVADGVEVIEDGVGGAVGAGAAEGAVDASNLLKPALARGEIRCGMAPRPKRRSMVSLACPLNRTRRCSGTGSNALCGRRGRQVRMPA